MHSSAVTKVKAVGAVYGLAKEVDWSGPYHDFHLPLPLMIENPISHAVVALSLVCFNCIIMLIEEGFCARQPCVMMSLSILDLNIAFPQEPTTTTNTTTAAPTLTTSTGYTSTTTFPTTTTIVTTHLPPTTSSDPTSTTTSSPSISTTQTTTTTGSAMSTTSTTTSTTMPITTSAQITTTSPPPSISSDPTTTTTSSPSTSTTKITTQTPTTTYELDTTPKTAEIPTSASTSTTEVEGLGGGDSDAQGSDDTNDPESSQQQATIGGSAAALLFILFAVLGLVFALKKWKKNEIEDFPYDEENTDHSDEYTSQPPILHIWPSDNNYFIQVQPSNSVAPIFILTDVPATMDPHQCSTKDMPFTDTAATDEEECRKCPGDPGYNDEKPSSAPRNHLWPSATHDIGEITHKRFGFTTAVPTSVFAQSTRLEALQTTHELYKPHVNPFPLTSESDRQQSPAQLNVHTLSRSVTNKPGRGPHTLTSESESRNGTAYVSPQPNNHPETISLMISECLSRKILI